MDREIEFRAKRIDNGQWVYGQYFKAPLTDENSGLPPESGCYFLCGEPRHCIADKNGVVFTIDVNTLGQWVGLVDWDGKRLYEDDIVSGHINSFLTFVRMFNIKRLDNYFNLVGNIHDNPELR